MGENLKVVWAEFSTLSLAAFVKSVIARHRQEWLHLELKTQPRLCPVGFPTSRVEGDLQDLHQNDPLLIPPPGGAFTLTARLGLP